MSSLKVFGIVAKYALFGALWILFSDRLLELSSLSPSSLSTLQTVKGWLFIAITSLLLYSLITRFASSMARQGAALRESESKYRLLVENQTDLVVKVDREGRFLYASPSYCRLFGKTEEELLGKGFMPLVHEEDREPTAKAMEDLFREPYHAYLQQRALTRDGWRWLAWMDTAIVGADGQVREIIGVGRDVTELKSAEAAFRESSERFRNIVEHSPMGLHMYQLTDDGGLVFLGANPAADKILGLDHAKLRGQSIERAFPGVWSTDIPEKYLEVCRTGVSWRQEHIGYEEGKLQGAYSINAFRIAPKEVAVFFWDIAVRKRLELQLREMALTDSLTGLANRTLLEDRLGQAIAHFKRRREYRFALLFLDMDRFKLINDSLGHLSGDEALRQIASRLTPLTRPVDTVARFGGDEFIVLLEDLESYRGVLHIIRRIQAEISKPMIIGGREVLLGLSIGVVLGLNPEDSPEEYIRKADIAMQRAKIKGRNKFRLYSPRIMATAERNMELEQDLDRAITDREFFLVYQPVFALSENVLTGFEALVRWRHPRRGMVSPGEFIPMAEATGKIVALEEDILRQACRDFAHWRSTYTEVAGLTMSVNLSARHLHVPGLVGYIQGLIEEFAIPPRTLKLEVTETSLMFGKAAALHTMDALRTAGIRMSVDDFGTGYSSLAYLNRLPLDELKIDIQFVRDLETRQDSREIVKAIIGMADGLGLATVAEGVETEGQRAILQTLGCSVAQGFLMSRPLPKEEIEARYFGRSTAPHGASGTGEA